MKTNEKSFEAWAHEAFEKFGQDPNGWKYKCPGCGRVQSPLDFIVKAGMGVLDARTAAMRECIGRRVEGLGCQTTAAESHAEGTVQVINAKQTAVEVFCFADPKEGSPSPFRSVKAGGPNGR